jgi:hypothetical protein
MYVMRGMDPLPLPAVAAVVVVVVQQWYAGWWVCLCSIC